LGCHGSCILNITGDKNEGEKKSKRNIAIEVLLKKLQKTEKGQKGTRTIGCAMSFG